MLTWCQRVDTEFVTNGAQITAAVQGTTKGAVMIHNLSFTATLNNNKDYQFGTNALKFSVEGQLQYESEGKSKDQRFLVPILLTPNNAAFPPNAHKPMMAIGGVS